MSPSLIDMAFMVTNSADPDEMHFSTASHLGLHCL